MTKDLALLPTGSTEAYTNAAYQVPVLTADEERDLAEQLRDHGDIGAARRLVMSHLRFVIRIARGYLGYGLPLADLIQEGSVGLTKAVRRFEPDLGVCLVSVDAAKAQGRAEVVGDLGAGYLIEPLLAVFSNAIMSLRGGDCFAWILLHYSARFFSPRIDLPPTILIRPSVKVSCSVSEQGCRSQPAA